MILITIYENRLTDMENVRPLTVTKSKVSLHVNHSFGIENLQQIVIEMQAFNQCPCQIGSNSEVQKNGNCFAKALNVKEIFFKKI